MTPKNNFCYAPFMHMYVHSNEGPRVCCMTTEDSNVEDTTELDLKKRWTSSHLTEIRQQFLDNEQPSICMKCFALEDAGGTSDRMRFDDAYRADGIIPNLETGNQYGSPLDLDIRPGNLCNLACRMCGPVSSSQLQKEIKNNPVMIQLMGEGNITESNVLKIDENIEFLLENANKGHRIKFLGGEPTIMPEVDRFLDILIERDMLDVPIHFTTNCTNDNKRFIDKISKFTELSFNYSIDGTGKTVEYIRHPVKFKAINKNIIVYNKLASYGEISYTLQAYNLFNLHTMIEWSSGIGVYTRPEILMYPTALSYRTIPKKIRDKRIDILRKLLDTIPLSEGIDRTVLKSKVLPVLDRIYADDEELDPALLARHTKIIDKARNQHIKDYIPEVWDFIEEEYNALRL